MSYTTKIISHHEDLPKKLKKRYESSVCTIGKTTYLEGDILLVYHNGKLLFDEHSLMPPEDVCFTRDLDWVPEQLEEAYRLGLKDGIRSKNK